MNFIKIKSVNPLTREILDAYVNGECIDCILKDDLGYKLITTAQTCLYITAEEATKILKLGEEK